MCPGGCQVQACAGCALTHHITWSVATSSMKAATIVAALGRDRQRAHPDAPMARLQAHPKSTRATGPSSTARNPIRRAKYSSRKPPRAVTVGGAAGGVLEVGSLGWRARGCIGYHVTRVDTLWTQGGGGHTRHIHSAHGCCSGHSQGDCQMPVRHNGQGRANARHALPVALAHSHHSPIQFPRGRPQPKACRNMHRQ